MTAHLVHPDFPGITSDPEILDGQACVRGTRLTVRRVLDILATYHDRDEIRENFPQLTDESIREVLRYAAALAADRVIALKPAS